MNHSLSRFNQNESMYSSRPRDKIEIFSRNVIQDLLSDDPKYQQHIQNTRIASYN
mgnify:CR=1 FL=1